ncbi:MAG: hypothetical protein JNM95_02155 [Chitinophagaceae bacterium]|nr:hypothetical protein [Chitinophagaceae bacterium]
MISRFAIALFFYSVMTTGCVRKLNPCVEESISQQLKPVNTSLLKLDGYYYGSTPNNSSSHDVLILYSNGVLLNYTTIVNNNFSEFENQLIDGHDLEDLYRTKVNWGDFLIDSNRINIEQLAVEEHCSLYLFKGAGTIINDTTFYINKMVQVNGDRNYTIETTYHFKQFGIKPDSSNLFVY